MSAIFLAPMRFAKTALGGDTSVSAPLWHLLNDHLGMVWGSSATAPVVTLNVSGKTFDSIVLWNTNLTAAGGVRVRIGPNSSGAGAIYDQTFTGASKIMAFLDAPVTSGFIRLDFIRGVGGPANIEMARLVVGRRIECDGIAKDAEVSYDDQSVRATGPGWMVVDEYSVLQTWKVKVEGLTEDVFFDGGWHQFITDVGEKLPFIFLPYYPSPYASKLVAFAAMNSAARIRWSTQIDRDIEMSFQTIT